VYKIIQFLAENKQGLVDFQREAGLGLGINLSRIKNLNDFETHMAFIGTALILRKVLITYGFIWLDVITINYSQMLHDALDEIMSSMSSSLNGTVKSITSSIIPWGNRCCNDCSLLF
jgi:hypothetical protein